MTREILIHALREALEEQSNERPSVLYFAQDEDDDVVVDGNLDLGKVADKILSKL